jgi:hypothetical protein
MNEIGLRKQAIEAIPFKPRLLIARRERISQPRVWTGHDKALAPGLASSRLGERRRADGTRAPAGCRDGNRRRGGIGWTGPAVGKQKTSCCVG